jgi:hypothetical protein
VSSARALELDSQKDFAPTFIVYLIISNIRESCANIRISILLLLVLLVSVKILRSKKEKRANYNDKTS